jgi:hypothetical protein
VGASSAESVKAPRLVTVLNCPSSLTPQSAGLAHYELAGGHARHSNTRLRYPTPLFGAGQVGTYMRTLFTAEHLAAPQMASFRTKYTAFLLSRTNNLALNLHAQPNMHRLARTNPRPSRRQSMPDCLAPTAGHC